MKAVAVFPGKRQVQLIEQEPPPLASPTAVRLRMLEVGVCGTDREICAFQYGTPPAGSEHLVIGHESLGQVVEVGPEVTRLARGDLVVTMVRRPCPHAECVACRAGRPKDLEDAEAIVAAQGDRLDLSLVRETLGMLERALDQADLLPALDRLLERARR